MLEILRDFNISDSFRRVLFAVEIKRVKAQVFNFPVNTRSSCVNDLVRFLGEIIRRKKDRGQRVSSFEMMQGSFYGKFSVWIWISWHIILLRIVCSILKGTFAGLISLLNFQNSP